MWHSLVAQAWGWAVRTVDTCTRLDTVAGLHAADGLPFGVTALLDHARFGQEYAEAAVAGYGPTGMRVGLAAQIT